MRQNGWSLNGTFHGRFQHDILMLKSSIKKENFLSVDISSKSGKREFSAKSLVVIWKCLYMHPQRKFPFYG